MKKELSIEIKDFTFNCIIGILDFERVQKQKIIINIILDYTFTNKYFINYVEVRDLVKSTMIKKKFLLLEEAIIHLEKKLYKMYKINNLKIKISKPEILDDCIVSLSNKQ